MNKSVKTALIASGLYVGSVFGSKLLVSQTPKAIKPFFRNRSPYVFAHRGGLILAPEHTMAAFNIASQYDIDGFEIDIRLTKDEQIVVLHDANVDRVSNGSGLVSDHTLAELETLDFGYYFKDINGEYTYRGHNDAKIVTLESLLKAFPNLKINIDIKDHPSTKAGQLVPSLLYRLIQDLNAFDQVLVTSFHDEQIVRFNQYANGRVAIGSGEQEVRNAFLLFNSGFGHLFQPKGDTFQIPTNVKGIRLDSEKFIHFMQSLNLAVGYWVVNQIDEMDQLLQKGAHTIVTDRPDIAHHLIQEKYKK
ncbi:glycerophosphodiester phosphodiesterase [Macrococcus sp. DPC7161]|uniref:glycerophosphodiester phosphodiesterase n=1 Tax=Macrococcus sp. DPC7161 TaxID=2507060 RepID=UPI00100B5EC2|nr:glycerophosphodiester phosphodiesterase [Macrococcus sp. DPC7161]RXK18875.1 glycerophosphodiester phosphodiesterase [Macrococcus sp. DPC7161]